jgi:hypothetical protein
MALYSTPEEIGPNNLEMYPFEEQELNDFCTGEILISAIKARADYECTYPSPQAFASLGPSVQAEVQNSVDMAADNIQSQTAITQANIDALCAPIISDSTIAAAPNAVPVGSPQALTPFTQRQLDAARKDPINWPGTLTIQATMQRTAVIRRDRQLSRQRKAGQIAQAHQQASESGTQIDKIMPAPAWGSPVGATKGWCGLGSNPWGKLLLFTGLGLIGASLLERK